MYLAEMTQPENIAITAWIQLFRTYKKLRNKVDRALKSAELPPLEWYDILLELDRVASAGLRPYELEQTLLLPQHGVSRLVDRMVKDGLASRKPSAEDGRGYRLFITSEGRKLRQEMWKIYGPQIDQGIATNLTPTEAKTLVKLLAKIT